MSKSKKKQYPRSENAIPSAKPKNTTADKPQQGWNANVVFRESVEAVAIAFILAFLVRTFEAEAFVIPTGSMATTLMGRHKDVECPMCKYHYQVSDSIGTDSRTGEVREGIDVLESICPICGYDMDIRHDRPFSGDRILVNKLIYCFQDPDRWDVAVFKYPETAQTNFIKRLVGLPNETLKISRGDLWVRKKGDTDFTIARKPPKKLLAMLKVVDDLDYVLPDKLLAQGWPARWQPDPQTPGWTVADDYKSFAIDGSSPKAAWLRYHHYVPNAGVWGAVDHGRLRPDYHPPAQLISDFCSYNSGLNGSTTPQGRSRYPHSGRPQAGGLHWVGDLAVSCTADVRGSKGQLVFELIEGGRQFQCHIDVATGQAELTIVGDKFHRVGQTPIRGPGTHDILFSNVDHQLRLWVDDKLIMFDGPTTYKPLGNTMPQEADLSPVGIASLGADVEISHIKVLRDIYYIAVRSDDPSLRFSGGMCDYKTPFQIFREPCTPEAITRFLSDPRRWPDAFSDQSMKTVEFQLGPDQFLMLGDNSAQSKDSRLWDNNEYFVDRELLIGKALFIYWPHSWDEVSIGNTKIPFPFFPNVKRMRFVR